MRAAPLRLAWLLVPAAAFALALAARSGGAAEASGPYAIGDLVQGFSGPGVDGRNVSLSDLEITAPKAESWVLEAARAKADGKPVTLDTAIDALPGLQSDGELDSDLRADFVARVGQGFGLVPGDETRDGAKTLRDLATWIEGAAKAPILVMVWSPRCPMCKGVYDERVQSILGDTGVRLLAVAGDYPDKPGHVTDYEDLTGYRWKVVMDPDQKVSDLFGATNTPHLFLLDADHHLRYRGAVDNDPQDELKGAERKDYLRDAIQAVRSGKNLPTNANDTKPVG